MASLIHSFGAQNTTPRERFMLVDGAKKLGLEPDCIAAVISFESGFNPAAKNPYSGASGLIQVMPGYVKVYGYNSAAEIRASSVETQIRKIVLPRFGSFASKLKGADCGAYYVSNFLPIFVSSPDSTVAGELGNMDRPAPKAPTYDSIYKQNYGFDTDGDGVFTVGDIKTKIRVLVKAWSKKPRLPVPDSMPGVPKKKPWVAAGLAAAAAAVAYRLIRS